MVKNKYILDIVTTPYLTPKGSSLRVDSVLKKLSRENKIDLLVYPVGEDVQYEGVNIIRVNNKKNLNLGVSEISLKKVFLDIQIGIKAIFLIIKNKYDAIHCEDFEAAFIGAILSLFFKKPKYIYDLHNTISDNYKITREKAKLFKLLKGVSKWTCSRFDMIIANWKIYENVGKKKTFLLYDESNIELKKISLPTKRKYLSYSGNFKKYQGVEDFVKVYSKVKPGFDLVLIGDKTKEIERLVKRLKLTKRVHLTGVLDIKESNYLLSKSEFCLIPRISGDQPGLKMIHHIMLNKVSLASDIPANTELLKDGYNSILYKDSNDLENILRDIDDGNISEKDFSKGIEDTKKAILKIWSYDYFITNYSKVFDDEK